MSGFFSESTDSEPRRDCYLCCLPFPLDELESHQEECYAERLQEWEKEEEDATGEKPKSLTVHRAQQFKAWDEEQQQQQHAEEILRLEATKKKEKLLQKRDHPTRRKKHDGRRRCGLVRSRVLCESAHPRLQQRRTQRATLEHAKPIRAPVLSNGGNGGIQNDYRLSDSRQSHDVTIGTTMIRQARLVPRRQVTYDSQVITGGNAGVESKQQEQSTGGPSIFTGLPNKPTSVLVQGRSENIVRVHSKGHTLRLPGITTAARAMNATGRRGLVKPPKEEETLLEDYQEEQPYEEDWEEMDTMM